MPKHAQTDELDDSFDDQDSYQDSEWAEKKPKHGAHGGRGSRGTRGAHGSHGSVDKTLDTPDDTSHANGYGDGYTESDYDSDYRADVATWSAGTGEDTGDVGTSGGVDLDSTGQFDYPDAMESLEPALDENPMMFVPSSKQEQAIEAAVWDSETTRKAKKEKKRGKNKGELSPQQVKSKRMRRILIIIIVLLIVLFGALGYFTWQLFMQVENSATQQTTQQGTQDTEALHESETKDTSGTTTKKTDVPELTSLIGKTQDEAVKLIGHGATVATSNPVNEEGNPIKTQSRIVLTDEPADAKSGTPTVYLGLNEQGAIVMAGYSVATASLGYGSLSFVDAVKNEHIIEKTMEEAGLKVDSSTVVLPEDKSQYSKYGTDGTTLVEENCSFSGTVDKDGTPLEWSAVLMYNYRTANSSGNLADTIRTIYVYVNLPSANPEPATDAAAEGEAAADAAAETPAA